MVKLSGTPNATGLIVAEGDAGTRLDAFLTAKVDGLSRTRAAWHILHGHVDLNDPLGKLKPGFKVRFGTRIEIAVQMPPVPSSRPQDLPLDVVYEDADVIVVAKRPGRVVHPGAGHPDGTLINALLHHDPQLADVGEALRPGLVHRLDKDTSGLLVVARNAKAHAALASDFATRRIERFYAAICLGRMRDDELIFDTPHGRHPKNRRKFSGRVSEGKRAITHANIIARSTLCSLVRCQLQTGRTHQIRVHLSERGHPVAGDDLYGGVRNHPKNERNVSDAALLRKLPRMALHAYRLGFMHPRTGELLRFTQPWPDDLEKIARGLFGDTADKLVQHQLSGALNVDERIDERPDNHVDKQDD